MFREIRRKDRLVSSEMGIDLLKKGVYGVLSVLGDDDYPYGVPVNYAYKDNRIYIHGFLDGHKIDAVRKHPKVCFTVVGGTEVLVEEVATRFISVIAFGKAEVVPPPESAARKEAFKAIMDKFIPDEEERAAKYIKENQDNTNAIVIEIEHMTCKQRA